MGGQRWLGLCVGSGYRWAISYGPYVGVKHIDRDVPGSWASVCVGFIGTCALCARVGVLKAMGFEIAARFEGYGRMTNKY